MITPNTYDIASEKTCKIEMKLPWKHAHEIHTMPFHQKKDNMGLLWFTL